MKPEILEALKGSIVKWERIVFCGARDHGTSDCPLCGLFWRDDHLRHCSGCPIQEKTGKSTCYGTPYHEFSYLTSPDNKVLEDDGGKSLKAAINMLNFLKGLLP